MSKPATAFPSFSTVNFYAGSKLNRLSWLRTSAPFLNGAITSSSARFLPMKHLDPLVDEEGKLATLSWSEVSSTILESVKLSGGSGSHVFGPATYGLSQSGGKEKEFTRATDGLGPNNLALVFLGVDESEVGQTSLPGELAEGSGGEGQGPAGVPYFALSLTYVPPGYEGPELPSAKLLEKLKESDEYDFIDLRASSAASTWPAHHAAVVAQAKSLLDWNERHQFCPACARRQYSLWAGYKRGCASSLPAPAADGFAAPFLGGHASFDQDGKGECPSTKVLSNFHYPRTDPVIIMAIVSADGNSVLLGRQKKWPKGFVSCLAGFCEPGESFEEAVRREVLEEAGVKVNQVVYHSSQPWPYPTNLMAGFFGIAEENPKIRLDLDNELEEARFYTRDEILAVLGDKKESFTRAELAKIDEKVKQDLEREGVKEEKEETKEKKVRLPPETAIARVLISAWARGEAVLPGQLKTKM